LAEHIALIRGVWQLQPAFQFNLGMGVDKLFVERQLVGRYLVAMFAHDPPRDYGFPVPVSCFENE